MFVARPELDLGGNLRKALNHRGRRGRREISRELLSVLRVLCGYCSFGASRSRCQPMGSQRHSGFATIDRGS
jgi:hypothetical protein